MGAAAAVVLELWGRIDPLVNNGRYVGPGHMDRFLDTPIELVERHLTANILAPLQNLKMVLPGMLTRGSGTAITITSGAGLHNPPAPAGGGVIDASRQKGRLTPTGSPGVNVTGIVTTP